MNKKECNIVVNIKDTYVTDSNYKAKLAEYGYNIDDLYRSNDEIRQIAAAMAARTTITGVSGHSNTKGIAKAYALDILFAFVYDDTEHTSLTSVEKGTVKRKKNSRAHFVSGLVSI